jgi:hypothetical protein
VIFGSSMGGCGMGAAAKGTQTPFVGLAATPGGQGYSVAGGFGKVYNFGEAPSEAFLIAPIDQC